MYNIRIRRWGINKHYRAKEKELLAVQIADAVQKGASLSSITYKDRPVEFHRILRHCRSKTTEGSRMRTEKDRNQPLGPSGWMVVDPIEDDIQFVEDDGLSSASQDRSAPLTPVTPQSGVITPSSSSGRSSLTTQSRTPAHPASVLVPHVDIISPAERMLLYVRQYYDYAFLQTPDQMMRRDIRDTGTVVSLPLTPLFLRPRMMILSRRH